MHEQKFIEKLDKLIKVTNLEELVRKFYNLQASSEMLEEIDRQISFILNRARKYIEELTRLVLFSNEKIKIRLNYLYWNVRMKILKGKRVNI